MEIVFNSQQLADELWQRLEPRLTAVLQPMNEEKDILSVREAADYLQMSTSSIYNMVCSGQLQALPKRTRRLFFSKKALTAWITSGENPAQ
jgi:excisionase family DNA binding protein